MSKIGKIIRVSELPPIGERENNVIYQVAVPGAATYTDYAVDANGDLKTHAVVDGSIPLELADNHISISDSSLKAEGIDSQAEYNISTREKLNSKLDKPSVDGNTQDYPKVLGVDDNGNTAALPAGDLGKNMMNSNLSNDSARNHILQAPFSINTLGNPYTITGLPNKNADFDNFRKVMVQNSNGLNAVIDGKTLIKEMPHTMTDAEVTAWKTAMNGGWTTNTMSVGLISPPVIDNTLNTPTWFLLKGANLNLNPSSFSVELVDISENLLLTIPNNQVQLYNNGTELIFYYNLNGFDLGNFKIRLWNGIAHYTSPMYVKVVNNLTHINLNALTWDKVFYGDNTSSIIMADGSSAIVKPDNNVKAAANDGDIISSMMSSKFINANKDFYLSYTASYNNVGFANANTGQANAYISLVSEGTPNNLISKGFAMLRFVMDWVILHYQYATSSTTFNNTQIDTNSNTYSESFKVTIQRSGSIYTCTVTKLSNNYSWSFSFSGPTDALCILIQGTNRSNYYDAILNLTEGVELS